MNRKVEQAILNRLCSGECGIKLSSRFAFSTTEGGQQDQVRSTKDSCECVLFVALWGCFKD